MLLKHPIIIKKCAHSSSSHHQSLLHSYFWRALSKNPHKIKKRNICAASRPAAENRAGVPSVPLCICSFVEDNRNLAPSNAQALRIIHQIIIIHPPLISSTNHPPATMGKSPYATIRLGLSTVLAMRSMFLVESYVVDGNAKGINILSRFADVQCKLLMTVGRTPSTDMREFVDRTRTIILSEVSPRGEK